MFSSYLIEISLLRLLLEATAPEFQRCILRDFFMGLPAKEEAITMQAAGEPAGGTPRARQPQWPLTQPPPGHCSVPLPASGGRKHQCAHRGGCGCRPCILLVEFTLLSIGV